MKMAETIDIQTDASGVCTLTLNRPEIHNALSSQMISELTRAAKDLGADKNVRVVVLTGAGASFCAGGDLNWMRDQMASDAKTRADEATKIAMMLHALNTLPKPLIGRLQGNAFGGGIGLGCVCDVAIGVAGAKFGLTETKLGLIPATIGPYVVARLGEAMARRVFMSSRVFGATEAQTLGILAQVVDPVDLDAAVQREVTPYLSCAPGAVAASKALARQLGPTIDKSVIDKSVHALVDRWESDEAAEGIAAFFDKRPPVWGVK
jgi:methylglutaconyl-CoA hydratase